MSTMKYLTPLIAAFVLVTGCSDSGNNRANNPPPAPAPVEKIITLKSERVEQRLSFDLWDNQPVRGRAKTVYYLVAEDGTGTEVKLSDFARAKVGEKWASLNWRNVD